MKKSMLSFLLGVVLLVQVQAEEEVYPVVVLGGGVGALTSALYLGRGGIPPVVFEGPAHGGAIAQSPHVQNWPGELEISGFDLVEKIYAQAEFNGASVYPEEVVGVDFSRKPFVITTREVYDHDKIRTVRADACIIALGSKPNMLGIPGENFYWTKGVYNCAVCDGALYKAKSVAVVGGGDAAVLDAEHLANLCERVYILIRKERFSALEERRLQDLLSRPNVEVLFNTTVEEIGGDGEQVNHIVINRGGKRETLGISALFLAIGATPNSQLFRGQLEMDARGYILLKHDQETSVKDVYAIGDIVDPVYKQAIIAAGQGAIAACQVVQGSSEGAGKSSATAETSETASASGRERLNANRPAEAMPSSPTPAPDRDEERGGRVIEITSLDHLREEIRKSKVPVFVDFYASWCVPCKGLAPMYRNWSKEYAGRVKFLKVNVEKNEQIANLFKVRAMPTVVFLNQKGEEVARKVGTEEIAGYVKKLNLKKFK